MIAEKDETNWPKTPLHIGVPGQAPLEVLYYYEKWRGYYPDCEMAVKAWFTDHIKPDWHFLDIGANIGMYSLLFSRLAPQGITYALEPTDTFNMLLGNLAHNNVKNVRCYKQAIASQTGRQKRPIAKQFQIEILNEPTDFITIDDFVEQNGITRVDCIKIDVDGYELETLRGAEKTLKRFNPYVLSEISDGMYILHQQFGEALMWLHGVGYRDLLCFGDEHFLFRFGDTESMKPAYGSLNVHFTHYLEDRKKLR